MTVEWTDLKIRPATCSDLPEVIALLAEDSLRERPEQLTEPLPQAYIDAFRAIESDPNNRLLVTVLGGAVVGTFQFTVIQYLMYQGGRVAQIEAVRVATGSRGRGIGERMMRWAIDEARRLGCARVQLTTNKQRTDAHRFYRRLGFVASHEGMKLFLGA